VGRGYAPYQRRSGPPFTRIINSFTESLPRRRAVRETCDPFPWDLTAQEEVLETDSAGKRIFIYGKSTAPSCSDRNENVQPLSVGFDCTRRRFRNGFGNEEEVVAERGAYAGSGLSSVVAAEPMVEVSVKVAWRAGRRRLSTPCRPGTPTCRL
jgi:hypothetical protein